MAEIKELLEQFKYYAENPRKQLDKYLAEGKKAVGIFPYYAPEEIVYAGGMVPFGVWGGQGPIEKAKDYFPTFYYSLALRCLEMALDGTLDGLSASMVTTLDDTLRPFSQNYKVSAGRKIPMVFLNHGQHRKEEFGKIYNAKIFKKAKEAHPLSSEMEKKIGEMDDYVIKHFRIAFGNRIVKHMKDFTPTFVECGGSEVDAVDYFIARKILRKFEQLNLAYIRDEIDPFIQFLDTNFGKENFTECKEYLLRLKKMV